MPRPSFDPFLPKRFFLTRLLLFYVIAKLSKGKKFFLEGMKRDYILLGVMN